MQGKTHLITGVAFGTFLVTQNIIEPTIGNGLALVIGSLIPDIDKKGTTISNKIKLPFHIFLSHRGFTHSIIGGCCLMFLLGLIIHGSELAFIAGFLAHVLPDMLTTHGIKLLWPLNISIKLPFNFSTGSFMETIFSMTMAIWTILQLRSLISI